MSTAHADAIAALLAAGASADELARLHQLHHRICAGYATAAEREAGWGEELWAFALAHFIQRQEAPVAFVLEQFQELADRAGSP